MTKGLQQSLFDLMQREFGARQGALVLDALPDGDEAVPRALALELHSALENELGVVDLVFTDNRRRMVSIRTRRGRHEFRVHHMFLGCDETVIEALVGLSRKRSANSARPVIREYIRENRDAISFETSENFRTAGDHHDLVALAAEARAHLPEREELEDIALTWGREGRGRRSIRFGSFDFDRRLVRIHPALDKDWVPAYFIEFVLYHEYLHAVVPPRVSAKRRELHPPEFREREEAFPRYDEAIDWESRNLRKILSRR